MMVEGIFDLLSKNALFDKKFLARKAFYFTKLID